jgi:Periplasmic sensor domain
MANEHMPREPPETFEKPTKVISLDRSLYKAVILTSCMALLLAYAAFIINDRLTYQQNLVNYVSILAQVIAHNSVGAVSFREDETAREELQALKSFSRIRHAVIIDAEGREFVEFRNHWDEPSRARPLDVDILISENYLELSRSIQLGETSIGQVYLLVDFGGRTERLYRFASIGAVILILALIGALLFSRRVIKAVAQPIFNLVTVAEKVGREKDYSIKARYSPIKELNTLIFSINNMLTAIHRKYSATPSPRITGLALT